MSYCYFCKNTISEDGDPIHFCCEDCCNSWAYEFVEEEEENTNAEDQRTNIIEGILKGVRKLQELKQGIVLSD